MNIRQMQYGFTIKLNQLNEAPTVDTDDIEYYLNRAQEDYVKEQHLLIKDIYRNQGVNTFEVQRVIENIRTLIESHKFIYNVSLLDSDEIANAVVVDVNDTNEDYLFYLRSRLYVDDEHSLNCKIIDPVMLNKYTSTKFNSPLFREPGIIIEGNKITIVYPDDLEFNADSYYELVYIKYPEEMSIKEGIDCELPLHTHSEIVDNAVLLFLNDLRNIGATVQPQKTRDDS